MVTINGTLRTLTTTKFPGFIYSLRFRHKSGFVTFKNGSKFKLTWNEFLVLRDTYQYWSKYTLKQTDNRLFRLSRGNFEFIGDLNLMRSVLKLIEKHHFTVEQKNNGTFSLSEGSYTLEGSPYMIYCFDELFLGVYDCDCSGKTVLDIGAFEGETAAFFSSRGAEKIVLYEPIPANFQVARQNMERNGIDAELHNAGISAEDGTAVIEFGSSKNTCTIKNVASVLFGSKADIAKIDCEGAEESIVSVPDKILQSISLFMIEVHSYSIREKLLAKFTTAGFVLSKEFEFSKDCSVMHFKRQP